MHKYIKDFLLDYTDISEYYNYLIDRTKNLQSVGVANEWLIDNFYLIVEYKNEILNNKKVLSKSLKKSSYIYTIIKEIIIENEYNINLKLLVKDINAYQRINNVNFSYEEISIIKEILLFLYVSKLNEICKELYNDLYVKENIDKIIDDDFVLNGSISDFEKKEIDILNNSNYLFEINNKLKEMGVKTNDLFKEFNLLLEENDISLREKINEEYKKRMDSNLLIANIFKNLKIIPKFATEDLYQSISSCEKRLMDDDIYFNMTQETKEKYRFRISKLAKKKKNSEFEFVDNLLKDSDEHIGFKLFNNNPKNYKFNIYIFIIIFLSMFFGVILSNYFISNRIIGFLILIIPINQLVVQLAELVLSKFTSITLLPKMNYSKKLPEDASTMVVIPTIISDTEKIKSIFEQLETFYIVNKVENIYFTLLADVKASSTKVLEIDEEIREFGVKYTEKLNKKYKRSLFHFVYRKRIWNESENTYLGYERKRGALIHFNKLLLHKFSKKEEEKYFDVHTFNNFNEKIKYVVTLDTDTKIVLKSLLNLIGCMSHPLNKPVLNKEKTKVINGYAIMQPRMNIDIESTNRSIYSQIFAGIGGFDTYSSLIPNFNQDMFNEGSFVGKGIYDLEIFEKVLSERFPDNLILSHDLLEGNYLRCAYVSDVEFIEDFPSKFLVDTKRQHRWARGDTQIISYILKKVKNRKGKREKNPLTLLGKWKIFNNILRLFIYPTLLITIICTLFFTKYHMLWILFIFLVICFPIFSFLKSKLYVKKSSDVTVYYKKLNYGGKALLLRTYIILSTIPYYTKLYLDAFIRSIYRMFISHKNLLNWTTAEEVEKTMSNSFFNYLKSFSVNLILGIILVIVGFINYNILSIIIGTVFISAPILIYYVSIDQNESPKRLNEKEDKNILTIARKTWIYFKDNLTSENNFLIPDNYQENREEKMDYRTSPTDIGYSLTSVVSAYELGFINVDEAIYYLENILLSISSLEKWHGHLYNWYNIKTKEVLNPRFISTIDSGNLVASLMIVREFLEKFEQDKLVSICDKLIKNTNFKKLYTKEDVFSIGYSEEEQRLSIYNYNKFASESRLTSFVAICKGDVPSKHWFCLDKSLTTYGRYKGLISWSGTAFEYFMPLLYMKNYSNTLLDETYKFAYICQKKYAEQISRRLPWGISESAYNELDDSQSYKYKSFSVPLLKAKEERDSRIVISPYSSIMVLPLYPKEVYENIVKLKQLNMVFKYGFYEAYDYDTRNVVRACFAHHQGMCLMAITNYLKDNAISNYFHSDVKVKTFELLLKEKIQLKANIDMKIAKYKKFDYNKERIDNDIRVFNYISDMPEVSVLSNKKYNILMNDRGDGFSRYRTLQLNRYRKITEQDYGMFMYIRDIATNKIWSNTYAPMNIKPDKYEVVFASDRIKYSRCDGKITTKTEIIVTRDHNAEIRKFTFINDSDDFKVLELTSYTEPIISPNPADVSHRVFNNMFLDSIYDSNNNALITIRKSRESSSKTYMLNRLFIEEPKDVFTYEVDRFNFIGRNNTLKNPDALTKDLSNSIGTSLEPIMSLRNKVEIAPNSKTEVYLICGFGRSMEQMKDIIKAYNSKKSIEKAFEISSLMNTVNTKHMNLTGEEMKVFNTMLNYLYQTTKIAVNDERRSYLRNNALAQNGLWKFGVSGDRPIILVNINDISNISFVYDILKAFEYFKNKSIFVDIIIVNSEKEEASNYLKKQIDDELYRMYTVNSFSHTPGNVYVIPISEISDEEKSLLKIVPRLMFNVKKQVSLKDEIEMLQKNNKINDYKELKYQNNLEIKYDDKLKFSNSFGGFSNDGREYVIINKNTPTPWSNIISNENFGTIITNNGCGYTYFYNSGEYKITSWTNEMVINDKSEGIKINNEVFDPIKCTHGFGYSILEGETKEFSSKVTEFVAVKDSVKIYILKLFNKDSKKKNVDLTFYINPTLGNFEEKTSRHILTEFMGDDNYLKLRNVYSIDYSDINVFMSSDNKIESATIDRILVKDINVSIELDSHEEKEVVFTLGCSRSDKENIKLINKYNNIETAKKELELVKSSWNKKLSTIKVSTPDDSLNYVLNGWYLYQTISSRIQAKAGFYQVSGAFGYRDQLQDAMNICSVNKEYTKVQILNNAKHQFREGDVLHWWHEKNRFGLRSRYKDDYLWLVYATLYYLDVTNDFSILDEKVPFVEGDNLTKYEHERGLVFSYSSDEVSLFEHLKLSLNLAMSSMGSHGLPLMGGGDWNDGMNLVGIKGEGESVWLGFFLYDILKKFIDLLVKKYPDVDVTEYLEFNSKLKDSLNKNAWDDNYYLRAYFDNGDKLGSIENEECKIDLISQSFSILSDVILKERIPSVINSVEERLVHKQHKIIKLLDPPFKNSLNNPGYIMNYPKGIRENGGQYTHATAWYIMSLIKTGYINRAYKYYQMINPINRTLDKESVLKYKVEPYVIAADIYSKEGYEGRGGWTWYTGSAGWFYRVGIEEILGIKLRGNYLILDPHIPYNWKEYKVDYQYKNTTYKIKVVVDKEEKLMIDGKVQKNKSKIKLVSDKDSYDVVLCIREGKKND